MKQKLFTLLIAVMASLGTMFAESGTCGDNLTWDLTNGVLTISGTGAMEYFYAASAPWYSSRSYIRMIVINDGVTSIGGHAFQSCSSVTSVTIPNSVASIGDMAFFNCSGLTSVMIPNSVTSIGYDAFRGCSSLTLIEIPNSVTSIGEYAFYECSGLTSAAIGSNVTSIGKYAFYNCRGLASVTIGNSVKSIGYAVFSGCSSLTLIEIPNSVTSIEEWAFSRCSGLTSVEIPNSVTSIGNSAFSGCSNLITVTIGNSVTSIGEKVFDSCSSLTSVTIGNSVTSIGEKAFDSCSSLISVTLNSNAIVRKNYSSLNIGYIFGSQVTEYIIGDSVTSIGYYAFQDCNSLTSVTIPSSVTSIGNSAFKGCSGLTSFTNYATTPQAINANVFTNVNKSTCTLYVPAESVEAYQAAYVWKEFGNILAIDDSTEEVNYATLADIYNMAADSTFTLGAFDVMYVPDFQSGSNMYIKDSTGSCVIYKVNYGLQAGDHVEAGLQGKVSIYNGLHEVIPITAKEELTITHGEAPAPMVATEVPSLNNASQYVVYEGVSFTTDTAFVEGRRHTVYGSWNGQTITFYNQYYIGATLSANKTYNITAVNTIYQTTPEAYPLAVEEVSPAPCIIASGTCGAQGENLTWTLTCDSVLTISGTGEMADYSSGKSPWYSNIISIKSVVFEEGVTSIGKWAFEDCSSLTSIVIPNSVISIGYQTFRNCSSLTSIEIPNSVTSIGGWAFCGCSSLTSVTIPRNVTSIGYGLFASCSGLTAINVASDNTEYCSIDGILFNKDQTILIQYPGAKQGAYMIPNSVTIIGDGAFSHCSGLTSVTIPNSVTNIGSEAFHTCSSLTAIKIPNSVTRIESATFSHCNVLASVEIPNNITYIGSEAFHSCKGLTSIEIPNGVTTLGATAFGYCSSLTSVAIPSSITLIDWWVFYGCAGLTSITNYATEPQAIDANVFKYIDLSACTLHVPAESLEAYKAADVWKEFGNITAIGDTEKIDNITVAQALEIGAGLATDAFTDKQYTIRGYVSSISSTFSEQYGTQSFYIADDSLSTAYSNAQGGLYIYRGKLSTGRSIREGSLVELTTAIKNYTGTNIENAEQNVLVAVLKEGPECRILSGTCGENLTWTFNYCDSVLTISGTGVMTDFSAGNTPWYAKRKSINTAVIDGEVTSIGGYTFNGCSSLTSFEIPYSIKNIGICAFRYCSGLTSVVIPNGVTKIGVGAFYGCSSLTSVVIPNGVTNIGSHAFYGCSSLTSVTNYATTPQQIESDVFGGTSELGFVDKSACTLYVPAQSLAAYQAADVWKEFGNILPIEDTPETGKVVLLADVANYIDFQALSISEPKMVESTITSTNFYTLANGTKLVGFVNSDGSEVANSWVVDEGYYTNRPTPEWKGVDSLRVGTMFRAASGTTIELGAFSVSEASKLVVYFSPNGDIERGISVSIFGGEPVAFVRSGMKINGTRPAYAAEFDLPVGNYEESDVTIKIIRNTCNIFGVGIHNIEPEPCITASGTCGAQGDNLTWTLSCDSVLTISGTGDMGDNASWLSDYKEQVNAVIIADGVTSIGRYAFQNCSSLTSVTIPNSVTSIGIGAFSVCSGLTSINVASDNSNYCSVDGVLFNKDKTTLIQYPRGKQGAYTIPNSVTSIGDDAFSGCSGLTSVTIPNSVTSIGEEAFFYCTGLTSVTIPNSVTSIGEEAFVSCTGLTSVTIGNSVTSIGESAFYGCTGLTSVTIPNSVTSIGGSAFSGCSGLTSVTIGNSITSIGMSAFYRCTGLTSITCEAITPPTLGSDVFYTVDKSIPLYVPAESVEAYQTADQWKDFTNIIGLDDGDEEESNIRYIDPSNNELGSETVSLHLPDVPKIEGFTFLKWQVVAGDLEEGIIIQAVYQADESTSASSVYTNPANPVQKLIRNGNVYILTDDKIYSITGQEVK